MAMDMMQEKLKEIVELFPSLSFRVATLRNHLSLLSAIILRMSNDPKKEFLVRKGYDIDNRMKFMVERVLDTECSPSTPEATMDNRIIFWMLDLEDIKSATKELLAIQLEIGYKDFSFFADLEKAILDLEFPGQAPKEVQDSIEEAQTSIQNLRAYLELCVHLVMVCESKKAPVDDEISKRASTVVHHTTMFLYSSFFEPDTDLNLKLTHLLQMTDPTHPVASAFYFKIFNSMGFSHQIPFPDTDEMNFIDHLLLVLKNKMIQCQECEAIFACEKLMASETLVKAIVSYSPLSTKIKLYGRIMEHATAVLSFSFPIDSEEKNLYQSFDRFLIEVVRSGFIGHLLHCGNKSLKDQLEKFSEYMTLLKAMVSFSPLRYLFSKIILHKFIVKLVIIVSSLASIDTGKEKNLVMPAEFDMEYKEFMLDVMYIDILQKQYLEDIATGEQKIGQYVDYLEEVQQKYLSSDKQAIISVQNLRSFQHLTKVIVNWYDNKYLWKNLMTRLLITMEHTTIFLCSCWIEPEKNQDFKTSEQSVSSPWRNVLAEASFIDHMLFYVKELIQKQNRSLVVPLKEQLENLNKYLTDLRNTIPLKDIVPSSQHQYIIPSRMRAFHSVVIKFVTTMESISITDSKYKEKETLAFLHDLEENVTLMKTELRKSITFNCPSIVFEFFSIFKNLDEMLTFRSDVIAPMKHQFDEVYNDLLKLKSFMDKVKEKPIENKQHVKDLQQRIIQVSHRADFIIQSYMNRDVGDGPTYYYALQVLVVMEDIQILITEIEGNDIDDSSYVTAEESYTQGSSEGSTPNITDIVVGFEDQSKAIFNDLTKGPKSRNIVAIVGMPGIGKTTMAKKMYNDSSVANHFDRRAWCCVSQSYRKKELLLQILCSIPGVVNDNEILEKDDDEIAEKLYKCLKQRRYLIVLDDVWETKAWQDLKRSFPDDNNHSRVIITSRNQDLKTSCNYVHSLQDGFPDSESYNLLQQKLFPEGGFPTELCDVAMTIAKNCKGLPLSVVLAAGMLSRMEKNEANWIRFAESLSKQIISDEGNQCKNLIELSYTHLPDHLKCCFLYFGAFLKEISVKKLTWLWIAEGFIRDANPERLEDNPKRLEDIAERYLKDLIGRSLVIGSNRVSRPGMRSCNVHDLLRDFCLTKAEEENFLRVVHGYNKHLPPDTSHFVPEDPHDPQEITHRQYRLSLYSEREHLIMAEPSGPNVRTLFFHAVDENLLRYLLSKKSPYDVSSISRYFKLINVLDLGSIDIGDSLTEVVLMIHLRYLEVKGRIESIPESIGNLWKLETFILRAQWVDISVPNSIWRLLRLRHLHIGNHFRTNLFNIESFGTARISIKLDSEGIANSAILPDMESFETPTISYGDNVEKLLHRLPNLRKLKCRFEESWDDSEKCNRFPVLEFLTQLVSLSVLWDKISCSRYPCRFSFPSNLRKLSLSGFRLPWSEISAIGKLPNLMSLKLLHYAFSGKRWDMREGEFVSLKYLKLEEHDIEEWSATDEHIPCLERLMLSHCKKLKEIPSEIGDIYTLRIIDLRECSLSVANSAKSIQERAEEEDGNDNTLKVHIVSELKDEEEDEDEDENEKKVRRRGMLELFATVMGS